MAKPVYMTPKRCTLIGFTAIVKAYDGERFFKLAAPVDNPDALDKLAAELVEEDDRKKVPKSPLKTDEKTGRKYLRFSVPEEITVKATGEVIKPEIGFIGKNGKALNADDVPTIIAEGSEVRVKFGVRQTTYDKDQSNHLKLTPYKIQLVNPVTVLEDNDFDDESGDDEDMNTAPAAAEGEFDDESDGGDDDTNF
jgi:hypothetical protein